jgi:MtfA peptidase
MKTLLQRWQARREAKVLARRAIPDTLWQLTLARLPFLAQRSDADLAELRRLASLFLDQKEFTGTDGLVVDDAMAVCIAAQAVLPVLRFGLAPYDGFVGIVVHPDEVVAQREVMDDDGVVHAYDEVLAGEAMEGGPVMLSWRDVADAGETAASGYNVVIHEFAHVLDMGDGAADGVPPLSSAQARRDWLAVLMPAYDRHGEQVVCGYDTLLDPYGAQGPEEFFAVASETFFVNPKELRAEHPDLYGLLARYYCQDPAAFAAG